MPKIKQRLIHHRIFFIYQLVFIIVVAGNFVFTVVGILIGFSITPMFTSTAVIVYIKFCYNAFVVVVSCIVINGFPFRVNGGIGNVLPFFVHCVYATPYFAILFYHFVGFYSVTISIVYAFVANGGGIGFSAIV